MFKINSKVQKNKNSVWNAYTHSKAEYMHWKSYFLKLNKNENEFFLKMLNIRCIELKRKKYPILMHRLGSETGTIVSGVNICQNQQKILI